MTGYVKKYSSTQEQVAFQHHSTFETFGWMREIPKPFLKDEGELRMFNLIAEGIEDLYSGIVDK